VPRIKALDGIRGLAILIVLVHNTAWIATGSDYLLLKVTAAITATGWTGVELFFVLSGFLITGILLDDRASPQPVRTFYIRRALRIMPVYYAVLFVAFVVVPLVRDVPAYTAAVGEYHWWYWSFLSNWEGPFTDGVPGLSHLWSVAIEEQFYLLWPLAVLGLSVHGLARLCIALVVATPVLRYALVASGLPSEAAYEFTVARWDALALGALLALAIRHPAWRDELEHEIPRVALVSFVALIVLVGVEHGLQVADIPVQVIGQSLVAMLSACFIFYALKGRSDIGRVVRRLTERAPLRILGKYSYAIYLLHSPLHQVLAPLVSSQVNVGGAVSRMLRLGVYLCSVAVLSVIGAMVSWRFIERPFLRLKDRIAPRPFSEDALSEFTRQEPSRAQ
jgi:peptidoglycan/LPS O-acetylase OafA/YrhL